MASKSLPNYSKIFELLGPVENIEIVRDTYNVPHIKAQNEPDAFFALGYAHAQDRLWQLEILRRKAGGRLSEVFGVKTLQSDKLYRRLDLLALAESSLSALPNKVKVNLTSYSQGINARINEINEFALGRGAPEFFLFPTRFSNWEPTDSIMLLKLMAFDWSDQIKNEILRARLSITLRANKKIEDIFPTLAHSGLDNNSSYLEIFDKNSLVHIFKEKDANRDFIKDLLGASNVFAASPKRSATRRSLLANDIHINLSAPSLWYLAHLKYPEGETIGATIPGIPIIFSGRNKALGWGIASSYIDDSDILIEKIDPNSPDFYFTEKGQTELKAKQSIIQIKNQAPITIKVQWTANGPVLPISLLNLDKITPQNHIATLSSTALQKFDTSIAAAFDLMEANTVEEGIRAMRKFQAPSLNLILADKKEIGFKTIGLQPKRHENHDSKGRMPSLGSKQENIWQGFFDYKENPQIIDPAIGTLQNTNNKLSDQPYPNHGSFHWGDSQRIRRLNKLLKERPIHSRESFQEIQLDTISVTARTLLPLIAADLWFDTNLQTNNQTEKIRATALKMLANWDGEMNEHQVEPLIYAAWMKFLQNKLFQDELGPLTKELNNLNPLFIERVFRNIGTASQWCDIIQSKTIETCKEIAKASLDESLDWLRTTYSSDITKIRWGDLHQAVHTHYAFMFYDPFTSNKSYILRHLLNIYQSTSGGDNTLQQGKTSGINPKPFTNMHAAGYRSIYDFADPNNSIYVISTGQSGHPLSRHYDDFSRLWRRGEYWIMSLDFDLARAASVGTTIIKPKKN